MKSSSIASSLLCILASSAISCSAFAPVTKTARTTAQKLSVNDFSLLISDAADAVLSTASDVVDTVAAASTDVSTVADEAATASTTSSFEPTGFNPTYSKASYYTTLALYVASFPGLWSQIKRSTKAKVKRKTYVSDGEMAPGGGKELRQQAGEIMAYMKANNYEVAEAGETITFKGLVARSTSQAFFLVFCTAIGMANFAFVVSI
mmetsp:Transcript_7135/g.11656  ORF Transcript_7135/g.11656 Transcript_7135/m.11656 type:complete len:206 (-) Transcript_7135:3-620(-)